MCDLFRDVVFTIRVDHGFGWDVHVLRIELAVSSDIVAPIFDAVLVWLPGLLRQ